MEILTCNEADLRKAGAALREGLLVAFPTETVYGLGGDAFNEKALARIFEAKRRPSFDPLIVHIAELGMVPRVAKLECLPTGLQDKAAVLCEQVWPAPLTLVLPKQAAVPDLATSGLPSVALRFPSHPVAQRIIALGGGAIAAPSANPFGYLSPTRAEHVVQGLGEAVDFIIDGGACDFGVESTVLDLTKDPVRILRPGGLSRELIEEKIGPVSLGYAEGKPLAPGMLKSHYAPHKALVLLSREAILKTIDPYGFFLFFDEETRKTSGVPCEKSLALSKSGDTYEAAAGLFSALHEIDKLEVPIIYAQKAPDSGLGLAINDRLTRAQNAN